MTMRKTNTVKLVGLALFTAIVVVLQLLGSFIHLGVFSISLVLVPIVIGGALYGVAAGAWLGFVFGVVVLLSGDANFFLTYNIIGTILTCLLKGALCGACAAQMYKLLSEKNRYLAVIAAAVTCPVVNSGIFLLGTLTFFTKAVEDLGGAGNILGFTVVVLIGANFLFELLFNIVLAPVILRIINLGLGYFNRNKAVPRAV